jgi:hypothetical protein
MGSSVSPKDEIWFLLVCHYISTDLCVQLVVFKSRVRMGMFRLVAEIKVDVVKWMCLLQAGEILWGVGSAAYDVWVEQTS